MLVVAVNAAAVDVAVRDDERTRPRPATLVVKTPTKISPIKDLAEITHRNILPLNATGRRGHKT